MDTLSDRINYLLKKNNMTAKDLSEKSKVPTSTISVMLNRDSGSPKATTLFAIARALHTRADWLWFGNQAQGIDAYDDETPPSQYVSIRDYAVMASAGPGQEPSYEEVHDAETISYPKSFFDSLGVSPKNCFRLLVKGDSMEPQIHNGDYVIVEKFRGLSQLIDGGIYALVDPCGVRIKRLNHTMSGGLEIRSDNPRYTVEILSGQQLESINIIGRVVERSGRVV